MLGDIDVKTGNKISPKKNASWEIIDAETASISSAQFNIFNHSPTLEFRLSWCSEPAGKIFVYSDWSMKEFLILIGQWKQIFWSYWSMFRSDG